VKKVRFIGLRDVEWICEKNLLRFVSDVMVVRKILIFIKDLKCKFTKIS